MAAAAICSPWRTPTSFSLSSPSSSSSSGHSTLSMAARSGGSGVALAMAAGRKGLGFSSHGGVLGFSFSHSPMIKVSKGWRHGGVGVQAVAGGGKGLSGSEMREAAEQMVNFFVESGMVIGLGSGPISAEAIRYIGESLREGKLRDVRGVPMSSVSASEAAKVGLPLCTLETNPKLSLAFTDADLVQEGTLYGVLGRRGGLGRESIVKEKSVAESAEQFVFLVAEENFVEKLDGSVPVVIRPESWLDVAEEIDDCFLGDAEVWRRPSIGTAGPLGGDFPLVTEHGHFVLDVIFTTPIEDPGETAELLEGIAGVVEHGLLLDRVYAAAVGGKDGVKIRTSLFRQAFTSKNSW